MMTTSPNSNIEANGKIPVVLTILFSSFTWTIYSIRAFPSVNTLGIISYISIFAAIILIYTFYNSAKNIIYKLSYYDILLAIILSSFSLLSAFSLNPSMDAYVRFTPWIDADILNVWHQDTAFHVALIKSIINWGYPSVALDGHPLATYHVLSHYIDAILFSISGIDAYDGYGFATYTKGLMLHLVCISLIASISSNRKFILLCSLIFIPAFIGTWHAIVSHALWATSFLLLMSAPKIGSILFKQDKLNLSDYIFLTLISILLCAGKISTGFAFICICYSALFFKEYKSIKLYLSSFLLIAFIFIYQKVINYSYGMESEILLSNINSKSALDFLNSNDRNQNSFLFFSGLYIISYFFNRDKNALRMLFSMLSTIFVLYIITNIVSGLNYSDKTYFMVGYFSTALTISLIYFGKMISNKISENITSKYRSKNIAFFVAVVISSSFITTFFYLPKVSISNFNVNNLKFLSNRIKNVPFQNINKITNNHYNIFHPVSRSQYINEKNNGYINQIDTRISEYIHDNNIKRSEAAIFIPKHIVEQNFLPKLDNRRQLFYGMNLYAMTGIQLISSVYKTGKAYGLPNYTNESFIKDNIDIQYECTKLNLKVIFEINTIEKQYITVHKCN